MSESRDLDAVSDELPVTVMVQRMYVDRPDRWEVNKGCWMDIASAIRAQYPDGLPDPPTPPEPPPGWYVAKRMDTGEIVPIQSTPRRDGVSGPRWWATPSCPTWETWATIRYRFHHIRAFDINAAWGGEG